MIHVLLFAHIFKPNRYKNFSQNCFFRKPNISFIVFENSVKGHKTLKSKPFKAV